MRRFLGVLIAIGLIPAQAAALEYAFPPDPIAPESEDECEFVRAQYDAILEQMRAEFDRVWHAGDYKLSEEIMDEVIRIGGVRDQANSRCMQQVYAARAARRAEEAAEEQGKRRSEEAFRSTQEALSETPVQSLATTLEAGGREGVNYLADKGSFGALAAQKAILGYDIASWTQDLLTIVNGQGYDRIASGAELGIVGTEASGAFGPLSALFSRIAISALLGVHEGAMKDLEEGFARFEDPLASQLQQQNSAMSQVLAPSGGTSGYGGDDLAALLAKAVETAAAVRADRSRASDTAMGEAEEARRQAADARRQEAQRMQDAAASDRPGRDPRLPEYTCNELLSERETALTMMNSDSSPYGTQEEWEKGWREWGKQVVNALSLRCQ